MLEDQLQRRNAEVAEERVKAKKAANLPVSKRLSKNSCFCRKQELFFLGKPVVIVGKKAAFVGQTHNCCKKNVFF